MPTHFICFYGSHCQLLLLYCKILREFCNRFTCLHQLIKTFTNTHIDTVTEYMIIPSSKTYSIFATYKEPWAGCMLSLQSCATLCNPMDCSPPGFSVHGIFQARLLEWVAVPSSRGSSWPRHWTRISYIYLHGQVGSLPLVPVGKKFNQNMYTGILLRQK